MPKKFKWKFEVELTVDEVWVADGFDPSNETIADLLRENLLGYAYEDEYQVRAKMVRKPDARAIRRAQGG